MSGKGRPSILIPPGEGRQPTINRYQNLYTGNLKGKWNCMVMSDEDTRKRMRFLWWTLIIIFGVMLGAPSVGILIGSFFIDELSLKWLSLIIGVLGAMFYAGLISFYTYWLLSPYSYREVSLQPRNIKTEVLLSWVREFCDSYEVGYEVTKRKGHYPKRYRFENGVLVYISLIRLITQPNGSILIKYRPKDWEKALEMQLAMDEFLVKKKIASLKRHNYNG